MALRRDGRSRAPWALASALGLAGWMIPALAGATPGRAARLGGVQAQGPATRSVTAIHHNPAMLGAIRGFAFEVNLRGGLDHRVAQREGIDASGSPNGQLGGRANLVDPVIGGFIGGSFMLDPVAIGIGIYDLSNRYRWDTEDPYRYQLADDPDLRGGSLDLHHDFSLAVAWNAARRFRIGGAVHFPVLHQSASRDDDTFLTGSPDQMNGVGCGNLTDAEAEDPRCAERIFVRTTSSRFNLNATIGVAVAINDDWTLGLRFRTRPWIGRGRVQMEGRAFICLPDEAADAELYPTALPRCSESPSGSVAAEVILPREVAFGVSGRVGQQRRWQLDLNAFWIDRCDGLPSKCTARSARQLSFVGLPQEAAVLPETPHYRGYSDIFGLELWGRYRLGRGGPPRNEGGAPDSSRVARAEGSNTGSAQPAQPEGPRDGGFDRRIQTSLLFGAGVTSPGVQRGAVTVVESERWQLSANLGARIRLPRRAKARARGAWYLAPGYGLDLGLPTRVTGDVAAYDPAAALEFADSGRDINGPGADAVLAGRARPTNAGSVQQTVHTFTFGFGWSEIGL